MLTDSTLSTLEKSLVVSSGKTSSLLVYNNGCSNVTEVASDALKALGDEQIADTMANAARSRLGRVQTKKTTDVL